MKNKKSVLKVIISLMVAVILVFIAGMAVKLLKEDYTEERTFKEIQKAVEKVDDEDILSRLKKRNSDVIGYLEIPDTTISYLVMQTKDNPDFYLTHDINKNYSFYGTPYLSAYCDLEKSDNLIIYGHNIYGGKMFGALTQYKDERFCQMHKNIYFTTEEKSRYEIFAVISVNKYSFPYWKFVMAQDETDYDEFINEVKQYSLYDTGITPEYGDRLITLSTCDDGRGDDYRFVVFGRIGRNSNRDLIE